MKHLLGNDQQQIVTDSNPYLCKDRILRRSKERLDMQVLLDPLEEQLNLPALPIKFCYSVRINDEVVRQESVHIVRGKVFIYDHAHRLRIVLGDKLSSEPDTLVADKTCMHVYFPFLHDLKTHVVLRPCDEVCLPEMEEVVECPEVHISLVHQIVGACLDRQYVKAVHVVDFALCHPDERGDGASQVQKRMHLHGTAVLLVFCPWTEFQAKLNRTAVKGIDHFVKPETEVVILIQLLGPDYQDHCKVTVYLPVLRLVHIGQCGLWDELQARVIQLGRERCQCRLDVTKAGTVGELRVAHHKELVTAGELQSMEVSIVFVNTFLKLILWNQFHQLREDGLSDRRNKSKLDKYYIQQNEILSKNLQTVITN